MMIERKNNIEIVKLRSELRSRYSEWNYINTRMGLYLELKSKGIKGYFQYPTI